MRIVCTIVKTRMMTTKSNSMMAFTSVEDLTGTLEVIVFPRVLGSFRDALQDNAVVVIDGRLSVREDEPPKLMAETVTPIDQYGAGRPAQPQRLYLRLPSRTCPQYDKVINLLENFDGSMPVNPVFAGYKTETGRAAPVIRFWASIADAGAAAAVGHRKCCNKMTFLRTNPDR